MLFPLDACNEHLQKLIGVDLGRYFDIECDLFDAIHHIVVTVGEVLQDFAIYEALAVGNRFAARKFTPGFDIHMHELQVDKSAVNRDANREWVEHFATWFAIFFVERHKEVRELIDEFTDGAGIFSEGFHLFARKQCFVANVETDHGERPASLKDHLGRFRIIINIELRGGVLISPADSTSHYDDFSDEGDFVRIGVDHFNDQVGSPALVNFALARWEVNVAHAVFAVPELRSDLLLKEGMLRASGNGNITTIGEGNEAESVFKALRSGDVSGNNGECADIEFGGVEGQHDGHGVIGAGIGIYDDFPGPCQTHKV